MMHSLASTLLQTIVLFFALRGASFFWLTIEHPFGFPLAFLAVPALFALSFLIADARYALVLCDRSRDGKSKI